MQPQTADLSLEFVGPVPKFGKKSLVFTVNGAAKHLVISCVEVCLKLIQPGPRVSIFGRRLRTYDAVEQVYQCA